MPELKAVSKEGWIDADVDWNTYAYVDKAQESKRLALLAEKSSVQATVVATRVKKTPSVSWSNKVTRKEEKERRREKKSHKRKWLSTQKIIPSESGTEVEPASNHTHVGSSPCDRVDIFEEDDWAEHVREGRSVKRSKKDVTSHESVNAAFSDL